MCVFLCVCELDNSIHVVDVRLAYVLLTVNLLRCRKPVCYRVDVTSLDV